MYTCISILQRIMLTHHCMHVIKTCFYTIAIYCNFYYDGGGNSRFMLTLGPEQEFVYKDCIIILNAHVPLK